MAGNEEYVWPSTRDFYQGQKLLDCKYAWKSGKVLS